MDDPHQRLKSAVLEYARRRFHDSADWLSFTTAVKEHCTLLLGESAAREFYRDPAFREVHSLIIQLAMRRCYERPTRMVTVRMPRELHDALKNEAEGRSTSLNRLCIAKLLGAVNESPSQVVAELEVNATSC